MTGERIEVFVTKAQWIGLLLGDKTVVEIGGRRTEVTVTEAKVIIDANITMDGGIEERVRFLGVG